MVYRPFRAKLVRISEERCPATRWRLDAPLVTTGWRQMPPAPLLAAVLCCTPDAAPTPTGQLPPAVTFGSSRARDGDGDGDGDDSGRTEPCPLPPNTRRRGAVKPSPRIRMRHRNEPNCTDTITQPPYGVRRRKVPVPSFLAVTASLRHRWKVKSAPRLPFFLPRPGGRSCLFFAVFSEPLRAHHRLEKLTLVLASPCPLSSPVKTHPGLRVSRVNCRSGLCRKTASSSPAWTHRELLFQSQVSSGNLYSDSQVSANQTRKRNCTRKSG
jgi:hypothetical protein